MLKIKDVKEKNSNLISISKINSLQDGGSISGYMSGGGPGHNYIEITAKLSGVTHFKYASDVYGNNSGSIILPSLKLLSFYIFYIVIVHVHSK